MGTIYLIKLQVLIKSQIHGKVIVTVTEVTRFELIKAYLLCITKIIAVRIRIFKNQFLKF